MSIASQIKRIKNEVGTQSNLLDEIVNIVNTKADAGNSQIEWIPYSNTDTLDARAPSPVLPWDMIITIDQVPSFIICYQYSPGISRYEYGIAYVEETNVSAFSNLIQSGSISTSGNKHTITLTVDGDGEGSQIYYIVIPCPDLQIA